MTDPIAIPVDSDRLPSLLCPLIHEFGLAAIVEAVKTEAGAREIGTSDQVYRSHRYRLAIEYAERVIGYLKDAER